MRPALAPGDRLLLRYGAVPVLGDVVVARFSDGTVAVKRVARRVDSGWWLLGDNPDGGSIDSRHRGPVAEADILAVAPLRLWPRPGRLRRT